MSPEFDKQRIRKDFDKAAEHYHAKARIQKIVAERLFEHCREVIPKHARVLDVGAGTGFLDQYAEAHGMEWEIYHLDLSERMCFEARKQTANPLVVNADVEYIPFASDSFDAVFSSLTFQWLENPEPSFAELMRVLKPECEAFVSSFGPDTLHELRDAFMNAEGENNRVNRFLTMERLRNAAYAQGFDNFFSELDLIKEYHPTARDVMEATRGIGASNKMSQRSRALSGKGRFKAMEEQYQTLFGEEQGLPLTWEIYYFSVQKP
jgi:malonyl-CoA O-methyltransferase